MADLHVSKKNIIKLLSDMQGRKFVIPDYQRPYKWDIEKCETLWQDIKHFMHTDAQAGGDYFLGTIVSFTNKEGNQEIIDGQQRITTFFLLLRAFYAKLQTMTQDETVLNLQSKLAPCIWDVDELTGKVTSTDTLHITSLVATEEDNETFHSILIDGAVPPKAKDHYSQNYEFFLSCCDEYARIDPMQWQKLCITILNKCIVLPIECETSETALTIFSTLNDRGLPLSDSDIFKAQIYRSKGNDDDRKAFTQTWKDLSQTCKDGHVRIDDVFRFYSHVIRARNSNKNKEMGLRRFYAENNYQKLHDPELVSEIMALAEFWRYLNTGKAPDEECSYLLSTESWKFVQILNRYPNDFWKYAVSVFFIRNRSNELFDSGFKEMIKQLTASLLTIFISRPTVNAIKDDTYSSCIRIMQGQNVQFRVNWNEDQLRLDIERHQRSRITSALLLLSAYLHPSQSELIDDGFEIEHIFPRKWQETNYNGWSHEDAKSYLERLGNKVVLEKRQNIQAGNGYFAKKKLHYNTSKIAVVEDLGALTQNDWLQKDIEEREETLKDSLINFFKVQLSPVPV